MSKINENDDFEPTAQLKHRLGYLRKTTRKYSGHTFKGLYDSYNYGLLGFLFFLVVVFETYTIYQLWGDIESYWLLLAPFALDVLISVIARMPQSSICRSNARKILADKLKLSFYDSYSWEYSKSKDKSITLNLTLLKYFFHFILLIIAAAKIYYIYTYFSGSSVEFRLLVGAQIVIFAIHIYATGAFILEYHVRRKLKECERALSFLNDKKENRFYVKFYREYIIPNDTILNPGTTGKHKLENNKNVQTLSTWGFFEDEDLKNLVDQQTTKEQREKMALHGLKHQLDIDNGDAFRK